MKDKISIKDYVGWGITIILGITTLILGHKNQKLENNMQQIHNNAKIIHQYITNNNYNLPMAVIEAVDVINTASGPVVTWQTSKDK